MCVCVCVLIAVVLQYRTSVSKVVMHAVVRDRHRYPDAVAAAKQIGIHNLVSLHEGAPPAALWDAYLKATDPSRSASPHVFALPVTLVWPLVRPQNLINLGEALVFACHLPEHFLHINTSKTLALAHSLWSDIFVDGK